MKVGKDGLDAGTNLVPVCKLIYVTPVFQAHSQLSQSYFLYN